MASFTAGTIFTDGVANDVTAAKLGALVTNATPTSGFIQDRTAETVIASNDTVLIGDASDSNNLKRITVDNLMKADMTGNINSTSGTIATVTLGTSIGTAATFTSGTLTTGVIPNLTIGTTTGTAASFTNGTITTGLIPTLTAGTTTSTAATITTGTIPTLVATTLITSGTGTAAAPAIVPTGDTNNGLFFPAADNIAVSTNGTERVRVDSSGNVGIGVTTGTIAGDAGPLMVSSTSAVPILAARSGDGNVMRFYRSGTQVGSINLTSGATAYVTSSDYRLKTNLEQISNGIDRIKQLPVYRFNWIADQNASKVDGFVAHEVKQIVPEAITGDKDAVDADGKPIYQGIDQSKIVPLLTAALKEAIVKIETLESKVAALEAA